MRVLEAEIGPFSARCAVLGCERTGRALVVDPGFDFEVMEERVAAAGLVPELIVLTHAHVDHAYGCARAKAVYPPARLLVHPDDLPILRNLEMQAQMFGFPPPDPVREDGHLADGQRLAFGEQSVLVRHTPGHSPGHVVLIADGEQPALAVVGDVLFAGSVGRTDLWGGSFESLERSIREVLYRLPAATRLLPGHGPETTVGEEMATNPFVPG